MTHAPETVAINRLHFSGADFWYMIVSCKFRTGFFWYHIPVPIRTLSYSKPETAGQLVCRTWSCGVRSYSGTGYGQEYEHATIIDMHIGQLVCCRLSARKCTPVTS